MSPAHARKPWGRLLITLLVLGSAGVLVADVRMVAVSAPASAPVGQPAPVLAEVGPCSDVERASCGYLEVPLDRHGSVPDRLRLRVVMADNAAAPRGVLVLLSGGPGQPGLPFFAGQRRALPDALAEYRLVMIDQRGTGATAIRCPRLQSEVGSSDVRVATEDAVRSCAADLGARRDFYTSADTVADLDDLRAALGVDSWTLDGVSYGSYVAQRYALTHPGRVRRLVLDSVVRQDNADPLYVAALRASAPVLRAACTDQGCPTDPAADLAEAIRRTGRGVDLLDTLILLSIVDPSLADPQHSVLFRLRTAAAGEVEPLNRLLDEFGEDDTPVELYSAGLHLATLCADIRSMPWGDSSAPLSGRAAAVDRAVAAVAPADAWPFPVQVAGEQGIVANCRHWPPSRPEPPAPTDRITVPTLLLNGERDLSTPVEWAQQQEALLSNGKLVVIPGAGHSVQRRSADGAREVVRFLLS